MIDVAAEALRAEQRIRPHVRETRAEPSPHFSRQTGAEVVFKLENLQHTGSFKIRGAMNRLLVLEPEERKRGVIAASTGNHGAAVAHGVRRLGVPALIFVPRNASPNKVDAISRLGVQVRVHGHDPAETEAHARDYAENRLSVHYSDFKRLAALTESYAAQRTLSEQDEAYLEHLQARDSLFPDLDLNAWKLG